MFTVLPIVGSSFSLPARDNMKYLQGILHLS